MQCPDFRIDTIQDIRSKKPSLVYQTCYQIRILLVFLERIVVIHFLRLWYFGDSHVPDSSRHLAGTFLGWTCQPHARFYLVHSLLFLQLHYLGPQHLETFFRIAEFKWFPGKLVSPPVFHYRHQFQWPKFSWIAKAKANASAGLNVAAPLKVK